MQSNQVPLPFYLWANLFSRVQTLAGSYVRIGWVQRALEASWRWATSTYADPARILIAPPTQVKPPQRISPSRGALTTTIAELGLEGFTEFTRAAQELYADEANSEVAKNFAAIEGEAYAFRAGLLPPEVDPEAIFTKFILQPKLIAIVEDYLGLRPRLYSTQLSVDRPSSSPPSGSQMFHRDPDDFKNLKVFIYLSDVDANSGPTSYIPRETSIGAYRFFGKGRKYRNGQRIDDESMSALISRSEWVEVVGPKGTISFVDTCSNFHRGVPPRDRERLMFTAAFASHFPKREWPLR